MARLGNGTSGKIISAAQTTPTAYSVHFWYQNASAPAASGVRQPLALGGTVEAGFSWNHSSTFIQAWFHRTTGAYVAAKLTSTLSANTWYAIGATWDGSNIRCYLNGVKEATTAATTIFGVNPKVCALAGPGGTGNFDQGRIAEVAYWSIALTDQQMAAVGKGRMSPQLVKPDSLLIYWPLFGDATEPDYSGGLRSGTVTATTIVAHPPVAAGLI